MKASSWQYKILTGFCLLGIGLALISQLILASRIKVPSDLKHRYDEINCTYTGVNPFRVFNREVTHPIYCGDPRDDFPEREEDVGKARVHCYPPWHTAYCWFFGYVSFPYCMAIVYTLYGLSICLLCWYLKPIVLSLEHRAFSVSFMGLYLSFPFLNCFIWGNYGILLMGLFVLMCCAIEKKHDVLVGVIWALIMTKPQVGLLFFWPLLFQKKYLSISIATLICCMATLYPAWLCHENPVDLILQIPQIGKPYIETIFTKFLRGEGVRDFANLVWMGLCFAYCGILSYYAQSVKLICARFIPVFLIFPIWTYSQSADCCIAWTIPLSALLAFWSECCRVRLISFGYILRHCSKVSGNEVLI